MKGLYNASERVRLNNLCETYKQYSPFYKPCIFHRFVYLCSLVVTFSKQFGPRSGQQEVGLDLEPNCLTSYGIPEDFFFEKFILKNISKRRNI